MARHRAVRGLANNWRNELDDLDYCSDDGAPPLADKPQPRQPPKPQQKQPFVSKKERQAHERAQQQAQDPAPGQPPLQPQGPSQPAPTQPLSSQPSARTAGPPAGLGLQPGLGATSAAAEQSGSTVDDMAVASLVGMGFDADAAASALALAAGSVEAALEHLVVGRSKGPVSSAPGISAAGGEQRGESPDQRRGMDFLHVVDRSKGPVSSAPRHGAASEPSSAAAPAVLREDAPDLASEQVNLVVVGHVDAGKSTLMGRLLLLAGTLDARALHRCEDKYRSHYPHRSTRQTRKTD
jgi:hypothetical protein